MGVVYEAEQISLNRRVALKILRYAVADRDAMERFRREAETVANLHHSNIVPIFAVGEEDGQHYFAMQFIDGQSLADVQEQTEQPIDPMDIADWGLQTAEALAYAHGEDIIHRDVKPSNLIRDGQGRVWLTDFGLAKRLDDVRLSMTGAILGTPRYMSPEQASSVRRPVDHRTDIYSLGATLYELATAQPLFNAESPHVALGQIIAEDPKPPRAIRSSLPRDLETIIMRCISKQAEDRYETANELVGDLRAYIDGRPIAARRPGVVEQFGRWLQKHQKLVTTAGIAAAVAASVILLSLVGIRQYNESQLARIQFEVADSSAPMIAEITRADGSEVLPSFTIPTQHPAEMPQGDYRLHVRSDSNLSETYNFSPRADINAQNVEIQLREREVWDSFGVEGDWALWARPDGEDIVAFAESGIVVFDGATATKLWEVDFEANKTIRDHVNEADFNWTWRTDGLGSTWRNQARVGVSPKSPLRSADFNQDGIDDLVLSLNYFPCLLVLSGADGELIWCKSVLPETYTEREEPKPGVPTARPRGAVRFKPLLAKVNQDDLPDLIATIGVRDEEFDGHACVVAISGGSSDLIWRHDFAKQDAFAPNAKRPPIVSQWFPSGPESLSNSWHTRWHDFISVEDGNGDNANGLVAPMRPQLNDDENKLEFIIGTKRTLIDIATGEASVSKPLDFIPACPPKQLDINQDGVPELLVCEQISKGPDKLMQLVCRDTQTGANIWSQEAPLIWEWLLPNYDKRRNWPIVEDLEGDGVPEIIVPWESTAAINLRGESPWGTVQVLDGATGKPRWAKPASVINGENQLTQLVVASDLDGDGVRDVVSVSHFSGPMEPKVPHRVAYVYVDAFSGTTGKRIFWMRSCPIEMPSSYCQLASVQTRGDLLVVDVATDNYEGWKPGYLVCFSLTARKFVWVKNDVARPQFADLDKDGNLELVAWRPKHRVQPFEGGKLRAWRLDCDSQGRVPAEWTWADHPLRPLGDVNEDGVEDAIRLSEGNYRQKHVDAVSGATGEKLWNVNCNTLHGNKIKVTPLKYDVDGDGVPDWLASSESFFTRNPPLEARSGRDGDLLWRFSLPEAGSWNQDRLMGIHDLDGDGRLEILLLAQSRPNSQGAARFPMQSPVQVFCIAARTGALKWQFQVSGIHQWAHHLLRSHLVQILDVNRDGNQDVVCYYVDDTQRIGIQAISGNDGTQVWKTSNDQLDMPNISIHEWREYPWFVAYEGEAGPRVAMIQHSWRGSKGDVTLLGLDGESGKQLWKSKTDAWVDSLQRRHVPGYGEWGVSYPTVFRTANGESPGFWYSASDQELKFVLLNESGGQPENAKELLLAERDGLPSKEWYSYPTNLKIFPADLDHDGVDEVIFTKPGAVVAQSLSTGDVIWEHELPTPIGRIEEVTSREDDIEIVVACKQPDAPPVEMIGINAAGERVWRAKTPGLDVNSRVKTLTATGTASPRILVTDNRDFSRGIAAVRTSGVSPATGSNVAKALPPVSPDPRYVRDLPWSPHAGLVGQLVTGLALAFVLLVMPLAYLRTLARGQWSLKMLLLAPLVVGVWLAVGRIPFNFMGGSTLDPIRENLLISAFSLPILIFAASAFNCVRNARWYGLLRLFVAMILLAALFTVWGLWLTRFFADPEPIRIRWDLGAVWMTLYQGMNFTGVCLAIWQLFRIVTRRLVRWRAMVTS